MARYPSEWVDAVRERSNIVEIVGGYVPLRRNGSQYLGLCPFHGEKTPSFNVSEDRQVYYCFGCHAGGNVFNFVMEMERMEFPEAVRFLAERAGMPIPEEETGPAGPSRDEKQRMIDALTEAARWYHRTLYSPQGSGALDYLHGRGLGDRTIRRFGLGATAAGWDALKKALLEQGFEQRTLSDAGLITVRDSGSFDTFRERAMFPIFDRRGRVMAFGGRILGDGNPKYLNSSDTPVFHKRATVYALNFLKGKQKRMYLVEGYMDVVSLYQHGVRNAVATLGTALTNEQARLIKRSCEMAVLVYDGDSAGQRATERALEIFDAEGLESRVAVVPGGKDPDEYVREHGADAFENLELLSPTEYRLVRKKEGADLSTQDGRTQYAIDAAAILRRLHNPVEIEAYLKTIAFETGFSREVLKEQIGRSPRGRSRVQVSTHTPAQSRDTNQKQAPDYVKAQRQLVSLLAACSEIPVGLKDIRIEDFTDPICRRLAEGILPAIGNKAAASRVLDEEDDPQTRAEMSAILQLEEHCSPEKIPELIQDCRNAMMYHELERRRELLQQDIVDEPDGKKLMEKMVQIDQLTKEMNKYSPKKERIP